MQLAFRLLENEFDQLMECSMTKDDYFSLRHTRDQA
jgi:hypothetical protein